jgi:RimJ/RimL family protein N-acetyltransferase
VKAPLQFETDRLILAAPAPADADAIFERYASDPDVTRTQKQVSRWRSEL